MLEKMGLSRSVSDSRVSLRLAMRSFLTLAIFLFVPFLQGANLAVDATKKKTPKIIQPSMQKAKLATGIQNKRYRTEMRRTEAPMRGSDKPFAAGVRSASDSRDAISDKRSPLVDANSRKTLEIRDQVVTASSEFEKAYRNALKAELSKRAAAQVDIRKTKKKASQSDINRDAKVRRESTKAIEVQRAGSSDR